MRPALALCVAAFALLLPACGGDERKEAVAAAQSWLTAVGKADAGAACALMQPSAVDALRKKLAMNADANCTGAVRAYARSFARGEVDSILRAGLEAEGPVKKGQVGVFPVSGPRELQIVLMRRVKDEWKVASTTLGLTAGSQSR
jgi:hypothetical protein